LRCKGLDRQGVNLSVHHRAERIVNQPVPGRQRQSVKLCRYQPQLVMSATTLGAFVANVIAGIIEDFNRFRRQYGEALAYLFNCVCGRHGAWVDHSEAYGFPPVFSPLCPSPGLSS
jgi:hypothetical protein